MESEIDAWKEFREMSVASSQGTLAYDTAIPDILEKTLPSAEGRDCSTLGTSDNLPAHGIVDSRKKQNPPQLLKERLSDPADLDYIKRYTLQNNIIKIPELGIFKRKEPFACLATVQVIQKMLSQSTTITTSALIIASLETENKSLPIPTNSVSRHSLQYRRPTPLGTHDASSNLTSQDYKPSRSLNNWQVYNASTSKSPFERIEDERRSRLYDSLIRAQRRYAEKLSTPTGPAGHFTREEWESLGDALDIEDWEAGFLNDEEDACRKRMTCKSAGKKENMGVSLWKGKGKCAVDVGSDGEEEVTLRMQF